MGRNCKGTPQNRSYHLYLMVEGYVSFCWLWACHLPNKKSTALMILMPSWSCGRSHSMAMTIFS